MAYLKNVTIDNLNKTNGVVGALNITLDIAHPLWAGDTLHLEVPDTVSFGSEVTCFAPNHDVTCTHSDRVLFVKFDTASVEIGLVNVIAHGIKNPPSL